MNDRFVHMHAPEPSSLTFLHRIHPVAEQVPEGRDAVGAGEPAGHTDARTRRSPVCEALVLAGRPSICATNWCQ